MSAIGLHGITKVFGAAAPALDSIDLHIPDGEFMVLLGPSGCGKSTLLRIIAGLEAPSDGVVAIDGTDVTGVSPRDRNLAMVFQSYALYPHLSAAKNIGFPLRSAKVARAAVAEQVRRVADILGLSELLDRRPAELSGGQRQRVALARAMVRDPGAFLMDEPLSNLDARLRAVTRTELIGLHARVRKTFVYVTHDQVEAMTMADRIALLNAGHVEQVGTPTELYDHPASVFVASFLGAPPMNLVTVDVERVDGELLARIGDDRLRLGITDDSTAFDTTTLTLGVRPERMDIAPRLLDDAPADPDGGITATVDLIENLGGDLLVHCALAGSTDRMCVRTARLGPTAALAVGDAVVLTAGTDDIRLFHPSTGRSVRWQQTSPSPDLIHA
ncbi:ABC transporter ATP-binding protein [Williamsia phyllosphaerae]|uniref:Sugar ABC transporter ATP-binding protein n=1 Tax=Williamsia phyllosphaerae TaxID=885042 RepID=A0ABQ1V2U3_9NOCA|nr:ATP-binding cassette domain-containing protein [Williamsia phyllosphaerae]GGF33898.1 sugar ABC transporter ATP-binding protein [Williamsia phyllosphaerae]